MQGSRLVCNVFHYAMQAVLFAWHEEDHETFDRHMKQWNSANDVRESLTASKETILQAVSAHQAKCVSPLSDRYDTQPDNPADSLAAAGCNSPAGKIQVASHSSDSVPEDLPRSPSDGSEMSAYRTMPVCASPPLTSVHSQPLATTGYPPPAPVSTQHSTLQTTPGDTNHGHQSRASGLAYEVTSSCGAQRYAPYPTRRPMTLVKPAASSQAHLGDEVDMGEGQVRSSPEQQRTYGTALHKGSCRQQRSKLRAQVPAHTCHGSASAVRPVVKDMESLYMHYARLPGVMFEQQVLAYIVPALKQDIQFELVYRRKRRSSLQAHRPLPRSSPSQLMLASIGTDNFLRSTATQQPSPPASLTVSPMSDCDNTGSCQDSPHNQEQELDIDTFLI